MTDKSLLSNADHNLSKEDYLVLRAKEALATDIHAAKSWLITAKSLFPHSPKVQFEAYKLEKLAKNVKEAAECFSEIFQNFPDDPDIWKEIELITASLRTEHYDAESELLCQMFQHLTQDLQHRLLIMTADHSEDTMEHCKLLLLLLKRFPQTISTHGPRLVETLLTAEKHSHPGRAVNDFRLLLACDALPLLGTATVDLNPRLSLRLLTKSIEFYLAYIQNQENQIPQPWDRMFQIIETMGKKLSWELSSLFAMPWNREVYCDKIHQFEAKCSDKMNDEIIMRQFLICTTVIFLRVLYEHNKFVGGSNGYCLVEAFTEPSLQPAEPKLKRRKRDDSMSIVITSDGEYSGNGLALAVKLWDSLRGNEYLQRELNKLSQQLRLDGWINPFLTDLSMYKGLYPEVIPRLSQESGNLVSHLKLACSCYFVKDYKGMLEYISIIVTMLPTTRGNISHNLICPAIRHLHYVPLTRLAVLQYCCRLLLLAIKDNFGMPAGVGDYAIGHAFVLMQIDWPQEANLLSLTMERILTRGSFSYPLFQPYIICVDILEELTYLWSENGGGVLLDIKNGSGISQSRRMSTRGADKGVREEIKQIMRRQAARDGIEPVDELLQRFIINEKTALLHSLVWRIGVWDSCSQGVGHLRDFLIAQNGVNNILF